MRLGVVSNTHIFGRPAALPKQVLLAFECVDHIVHAGDIFDANIIRQLEMLAPVTAVAGNLDTPEVKALYGDKKIVRFGRFVFGICHGHGQKGSAKANALESFSRHAVKLDCIIFGHSHMPYCENIEKRCCSIEKLLLFNPGSPTDKRKHEFYSFGIIEAGDVISPSLFYF